MSVLPTQAETIWDRFWKTVALVLFITIFMRSRTRLHAIVLAVVLSLGLLAIKASVFTILTGGANRVLGPPKSQLTDNNHFGAVLIMTLPFAVYLATVTKDAFMRLCFVGAAVSFPMGALFTYSRGALLALTAVSGAYWTLSRQKIRIAVAVVVVVVVAIPFMPDAWMNRMSTIQSSGDRETADASVQGRYDSWEAHWEMAKRRPFIGGGFRTIEIMQIWQTLSSAPRARAAHNSYFQTLGEHGFPGLFLYLMLIFGAILTALRIRKTTKHFPELAWARSLATACLFSTISYTVSSLTLSLATFDLFYIVLAIVAALRQLTQEAIKGAQR
jgi:probable O-glycosylation ligase (exosortase A-associated)